MKRTKQPSRYQKRTLGSKKPGPKSGCTDLVIQKAKGFTMAGLTNQQMASIYNVDVTTVEHWYRTNKYFKQAVDQGRDYSDGDVAEKLYELCMGYTHTAYKFFKIKTERTYVDDAGNEVTETSYRIHKEPYQKHYKPDTKAIIKFLGARNRETWGESYKVDHKHAHLHAGDHNIHKLLDELSNPSVYSDEELEQLALIGFEEQQKKDENQITNGVQ